MSTVLRECILAAADAVESASDDLGRLDAIAGDGDHGVTMTLAARAVRAALEPAVDATAPDLIDRAALAMASVGGATGPIYAGALMEISTVVRSLDGAWEVSISRVHACAEAALGAISRLGGAQPGDKTVIDALEPVVRALWAAESSGATVEVALRSASQAARQGAESTATMVARVGRASRHGERSRGSADPGATSFSLIVEELANAYIRRVGKPTDAA